MFYRPLRAECHLSAELTIVDLCGVGDTTIKEYITAGQFPPRIQLEGATERLWWLHEIEAWRDGHVRDENFQNYSYGGKRRPRRNEKAHVMPPTQLLCPQHEAGWRAS